MVKRIVLCLVLPISVSLTDIARSKKQHTESVTIRRDVGGVVVKYHKRALKLEAASTRVVIDGVCASACTAYLRNACATPRARIGFHSARLTRNAQKRYKTEREKRLLRSTTSYLNQLLFSHYPADVKHWISRNGGLPSGKKTLWLEGREAQKVVGAC